MINLIPDWRREFNLKGAAVMHEAAALQARRAVIAFWKLCAPQNQHYDMINLIPGWRREFNLKGRQ